MKYLIIAWVGLYSSVSASAQTTPFRKLEQIYAAGTLPNPQELMDKVWSGRCYVERDNEAINELFYMPNDGSNRAAFHEVFSEPADFFDTVTMEAVQRNVTAGNVRLVPFQVLEERIQMEKYMTQFGFYRRGSIRMHGPYVIASILDLHPRAQSHFQCFFFTPGMPLLDLSDASN